MKELTKEKIIIEKFYYDLKEFMQKNKIDYKPLDEGAINFLTSDIDILVRHQEDLKKIKSFISNHPIKTIIKIDNKNHFYFIVIDDGHIHAFDFSVGLVSGSGLICNGEYFFKMSENGLDFKENYRFLKDTVKHKSSYYVIKENKKSFFLRISLVTKKIYQYVRTIFMKNTSGICLVFLGPDGSGKSTATDYVQRNFSTDRQLFQLKRIYFKPNVFKVKPDKKFTNSSDNIPHSHSSHSSFLSFCKVVYVFLNYVLYAPMAFIRKKNGHLILFDRHFYDILIDPKRYRINKFGVGVAKLLVRFVPKPDAVIILTSDISQLSARKPGEVTEDLLISLNRGYQDFSLKNVNVCHIVNNASLDELKENVFAAVLRSFKI